jgi:hypothetical protein
MHITTLIPAYKTKYLQELLAGLMTQTRKPDRIVISDDSPSGEFTQQLLSPRYANWVATLPLELHVGRRAGAYENFKNLVRLWAGRSELFHILLDDDVIFPDFYAQHLQTHQMAELSCSISARWNANERGQPIEGMPVPEAIASSNSRIMSMGPKAMFSSTVPGSVNWLGEFSNCVIRARCAELLEQPAFGGVSYAGLWDLGFFLAASLQAPIGYIQDRLGYFRAGGEGHSAQRNGPHMKAAYLGYVALAVGGCRIGQVTPEQMRMCATGMAGALVKNYADQPDVMAFVPLLLELGQGSEGAEAVFVEAWHGFLQSHGF